MAVYDAMGVGTALYMRIVHGCRAIYVLLFLVGLVPLIYNWTGDQAQQEATQLYVQSTLGNANKLGYAQSIPDLVIVLLISAALCWGNRELRSANERINPIRDVKSLNAAQYTCMIEGLPRDPSLSFESLVSELRTLFSVHGTVVCVSVARANRAFLLLVRKRQEVKTTLSYYRVAACRKALTKGDAASKAKLEAQLVRVDQQIEALLRDTEAGDKRPLSAGVCFVTFNYQAEAAACYRHLHGAPRRRLALTSKSGTPAPVDVHLRVSVPPPPSQIVWENLEFSMATRVQRRVLVNAILLAQTALSTYAIVAVNNINLTDGVLNEDAGQFEQVGTMAWTVVVIVASNLLIFLTAPVYMLNIEVDYRADHRETMLAMKLLFFQLANSLAASVSLLWTKKAGAYGYFDLAWYEHGGATTVISMVLADVFFINPFVEGLRIFDVFPAKACLAPRAKSQDQLNGFYAPDNELYLPFRMQLLLKQLVYGLLWSYAFPVFYLFTLLFLCVSVWVDESGLLRTFRGIVTSSDKMYMAAAMQVLPAALVLHCLMALFLAHHKELDDLGWLNETNAANFTGAQHLTLDGVSALSTTLQSPHVAIALALLGWSVFFVLAFVVCAKIGRSRRKKAAEQRYAEGTTTNNHGPAPDAVAFRELDQQGANPQLYLPPLTAILLSGARDRNASSTYARLQQQQQQQLLAVQPSACAKEEPITITVENPAPVEISPSVGVRVSATK